jgi:hypothetical protein
MKTPLVLAVASAMSIGFLAAADTTTNAPSTNYTYHAGTDTNPRNIESQLTKAIPSGKAPTAPNGKFAPRPTGVASDIYNKGSIMISPLAPSTYGYGEQNMTAAIPIAHGTNTRTSVGSPHEFGGLKLFGWDF